MTHVSTVGVSKCCGASVKLIKDRVRQWYCLDCRQPCQTELKIEVMKADTKPDSWIAENYPKGPSWTGD